MHIMQGVTQGYNKDCLQKKLHQVLDPLKTGKPNIQFKQRDDLIDFIIKGSVSRKEYRV